MKNKSIFLKKMVAMISVLIMLLNLTIGAQAESTVQHTEKADVLKALGLFSGTEKGYELDRAPNRLEAAVMLIRLLGKEQEAKKMKYKHPFTDVPEWAAPYVGYMVEKKLSSGIGNNQFGSTQLVDGKSYVTFILRAIGYDDKSGDFNWNSALDFAVSKEIISLEESNQIQSQVFLRDQLVFLSYKALKTNLKNSKSMLIDQLIINKVVDPYKAVINGVVDRENYKSACLPVVALSGEFKNIKKSNEDFYYTSKSSGLRFSKYDGINEGSLMLYTPFVKGWDTNLVAKVEVYNGSQLVKTMYDVITNELYANEYGLTFGFITPTDTFTSVSFTLFYANELYIQDIVPQVVIHKIPIAQKEKAIEIMKNASFIESMDIKTKNLNDERLLLECLYHDTTYYANKEPFIPEIFDNILKNTYMSQYAVVGNPPEFDFLMVESGPTYFSPWFELGGKLTGEYELKVNMNQVVPIVARNSKYEITDIIVFVE